MITTVGSLEGSRQNLFINGAFVAPKNGQYIDSFDPTTGKPWYQFAEAGAEDVSVAVEAARAAFAAPAWRRMTQTDRGKLVRRLAELVLEHADELALIETRDNGKLLKEMRAQMRAMPDSYTYFAGMADKLLGDTIPVNKLDMLNFNLREPIGVVGMITPWNSPLMLLTGTLAPCLALGNTVVVKPSEHASASTLALAELITEAGFPAGVVNVVTGTGAVAGDALTRHPGIAKLVFTGSTATGRRIAANAAQNLIPCSMELGGKSPHVVFGDVDIDDVDLEDRGLVSLRRAALRRRFALFRRGQRLRSLRRCAGRAHEARAGRAADARGNRHRSAGAVGAACQGGNLCRLGRAPGRQHRRRRQAASGGRACRRLVFRADRDDRCR